MCKLFAARHGIGDPCTINKCNKPTLASSNVEAALVWSMVYDQLITVGMGGIIGLNYAVVFQVMDEFGIQHDRRSTFHKVRCIESHFKQYVWINKETPPILS